MPQPLVTICFDDGRRNAAHEGAAILEKCGMRGTYFPITSCIGRANEHGAYASWDELRALAKNGHEIGNHSHSHVRDWVTWPYQRQRADIETANRQLFYAGAGRAPTSFAYPFGLYDEKLREAVGEADHKRLVAARTIRPGINTQATDPLLLRSLMVERKHGLEEIAKQLDAAISREGWLILTFHLIDDKTPISTPPALFEAAIRTIAERALPVVTLMEGTRRYRQ
jgi:peptidoglycan/xylan/chitin deacetylase (PgdA/CDA1 family)